MFGEGGKEKAGNQYPSSFGRSSGSAHIHGEYRAILVNPEIATKALIAVSPMRQRMIEQFGRVHHSLKNRVDK